MTDPILTKLCPKCQETKPVSNFSKHKKAKDGLQSSCKSCASKCNKSYYRCNIKKESDRKKIYYQQNTEKIKARNKTYREYNPEKCRAYHKIYRKKYYELNSEKQKKYSRDYRKNNPEKIKALNEAYRKANPEKEKKRRRAYYQTNSEKAKSYAKIYAKTNSIKIKERNKKYRETNIEKVKLCVWRYQQTKAGKIALIKSNHKRRTLKFRANVEDFSSVEVFKRDNYICQMCGCKTRPDFKNQYHPKYPNLDHIIPLSKGGGHSKKNTQCLCRHCNVTKSNTGKGDQLRLFG